MSLVDEKSVPSTKTELDLFSVPPTQVVVKRGFWEEIQPMNPITNEGPYEFRIPADPLYIQMNKNQIYMTLKIKLPALAAGQAVPKYAPINLIGKTFFKQVKCFINGRLVNDSGDKYAYRTYLETELNYGFDAKNSHLQASLYFNEGGKNVDSVNCKGFQERAELFKDQKIVEVTAPLHIDLFLQDRYLLNNTDVRLELHRNSNPFLIQCFEDVKLEIEVLQMKLMIRKVEIIESVNMAIETTMNTSTAKYPVRRVHISNLHIPNTARATPNHTLFTGQLPRRIIIGCVEGSAYRGSFSKSPFNFKPFGINSVKVISGGQTFPTQPLNTDFNNNKFINAYNSLFEALDLSHDNKGNLISRELFQTSHCLFAFDLTPDEDDNGHWDLIREGTTSIEILFGEDLPASGIEVIVYAEFDNLVMLDKNRNTFHDYSA